MDTILFIFIGLMCLMLGVRVYCAEERNKIFNKRPLPITELADIKKYNHFCAVLIIGFGVVAEITAYFMVTSTNEIMSALFTLGIIVEALIVVIIYAQYEKKLVIRIQEERKKK